jgi:hypothetical protein
MRPLVERLQASGYSVKCLATRKSEAAKVLPCAVEQAPGLFPMLGGSRPYIGHLADTLASLGWGRPGHLSKAVGYWRKRLMREQPRVLMLESAPTALLAAQGLPIQTMWLADQWNTPPSGRSAPDMRALLTGHPRPIAETEPGVVTSINSCLANVKERPIKWLADLFGLANQQAMLAIPEIDPHGPREGVEYLGMWGAHKGDPPAWPTSRQGLDTSGIFAYLKPFPLRADTFKMLAECGHTVLAYAPNPTGNEIAAAKSGAIDLMSSPVAWEAVASQATFIVCNGANTIAQSLQKGLPVLALPLSLEQYAVATRAAKTGAVAVASPDNAHSIDSGLQRILNDDSIPAAARRLKKIYEDYDPEVAASRLGDQIVAMIDKVLEGD